MRKQPLVILICLSLCALVSSRADDTSRFDSLRVDRLVREAPADADVSYFARQLVGVPYVAHTLETSLHEEPLVVNLRELDCTTLVEVVAALWHTSRYWQSGVVDGSKTSRPLGELTPYAVFRSWLERYRYWGGIRGDYCSRHHYFSWWWHDNMGQGLLEEVDLAQAGARLTPMVVRLNYMSAHPDRYRQLAAHPQWVERLRPLEQAYSGRDGGYLSQEELLRLGSAGLRGVVKDGDVIAIVTTMAGLDYSHLGFASWQADGRVHLLNASSIHKRVVDEPKTLYQYLSEHKSSVGVRIFRLK